MKATLNSARYCVELDGTEKHPVLTKMMKLCDRMSGKAKKLDNYLESCHPALAISYKFLKEMSSGFVRGSTLLVGGVMGVAVLDDILKPAGSYCHGGLSNSMVDKLLGSTLVGSLLVGPGVALWNTAKFAHKRLCKTVIAEKEIPLLPDSEQKMLDNLV